MTVRKLKKRLRCDYGKTPDSFYAHGDMEYIRAYYDHRCAHALDDFLLDDSTWNDLDMDKVYKRMNQSLSTSGEQYLYYMLRSPATEPETYRRRKALIDYAGSAPEERLSLQVILARLGCTRRADLCSAFSPSKRGKGLLALYLFLLLLIPLAVIAAQFIPPYGALALAGVFMLNSGIHEIMKRKIQRDLDTVNYSVSMAFALDRIRKRHDPVIDRELKDAYVHLDKIRSVLRIGGVSIASGGDGMGDIISTVLLLDLITYELLKNKLGRCHEDVFAIHEYLGLLDASISIASYRESVPIWSEPALDFREDAALRIDAEQLVHPLLKAAVPNDLHAASSVLITGSNASGKSTFLKTAALNAIMAQSICTCTAAKYAANAFRVYTSMALADNLLAGESYYIVETKSLKRILDDAHGRVPVLCVVDEVLRGTNTVERIAASSEVLSAVAHAHAICLAATHDIELCDLLASEYALYHFEETVGAEKMLFDYILRPNKATSKNAINLLRLMGFDEAIVRGAHCRADRFVASGKWT